MKRRSAATAPSAPLAPPPWLVGFQEDFGAMLRAPLDPSGGRFEPRVARYPSALVEAVAPGPSGGEGARGADARERLAVYHRQYWMRLFSALQRAFPSTVRAVGPWWFNHFAAHHLAVTPPAHADLDRVGDGFGEAVYAAATGAAAPGDRWAEVLGRAGAPPLLVAQAVALDLADRACFAAPWSPPWRPGAAELASLPTGRLRYAPSFHLVREDWALLAARTEAPGPPPPRRGRTAFHVLSRTATGVACTAVPPELAALLAAAAEHPFAEALRRAAAAHPDGATGVARALPAWIVRATGAGWWVGVSAGP